jgi:large conductance mechanosensitive channel
LNIEDKRLVLREAIVEDGVLEITEIAIGYGKLIEAGTDFLIIGLTVFLVIKFMNSLRKKADDPENKSETTPKEIELLHKIAAFQEKQVQILEELNKK